MSVGLMLALMLALGLGEAATALCVDAGEV
jgi:hypothetical protein